MAPPAVVNVEEMEVEIGTPGGEEEFATPRSSAEHASSPDRPDKRNASSEAPQKSGGNFTPEIPGDNATPFPSDANISERPTPEDKRVASVALGTPINRSAIRSHVDNASPALAFPISAASTAPSPHNRVRTQHTPSDSHVLSSTASAVGAPSSTPQSIKEDKELARLKEAIEGVSPDILHKFLRKEWRTMLFSPYEDDHVSYILRACLKNSPPTVVERGLRDALNLPGHRSAIANKILKHVTVDELITQVPEKVLDEAVATRLDTAPIKDLVKWLADAHRLGFKHDDIVAESDEQVLPKDFGVSEHSVDAMVLDPPQNTTSQIPYNNSVASGYKDPLLIEQERQTQIQRQNLIIKHQQEEMERQKIAAPAPRSSAANGSTASRPPLTQDMSGNMPAGFPCGLCGFVCTSQNCHSYHAVKKICQRQPSSASWQWGCANCGQKFTTKQGQNYHLIKLVCHGNSDDPADLVDGRQDAAKAKLGQNPPRDPILPPTRPTFSTTPRPSAPQVESPPTQSRGGVQVQMPRPPMHTPAPPPATPQAQAQRPQANAAKTQGIQALQDIDPTARVSPSQLSDAKKAEMDRQIQAEDDRYESALAAIDPQLPVEDQERRKISLKNSNASKKSQIRKSFGVTLRMREKDKVASRAVALASSPIPTPPAPSSRPAHSSPLVLSHISPPSSGFSPINAPAPNPAPPNANHLPQLGGLGGRPRLSTQASQNSHSTTASPSISGFGVLKNQPQHRQKRQRTSSGSETPNVPPGANWAPPSSRTQTPHGPLAAGSGLSMMEVSSEDASKKYPKKVPVGAAQAKWESLQPKKNAESNENGKRKASDAEMMDTHTGAARAGSSTRQEPIEIDSSSESERVALPSGGGAMNDGSGVADADKPLPSTEDTESEETGESRPSSSGGGRGGFMARRGGRRF